MLNLFANMLAPWLVLSLALMCIPSSLARNNSTDGNGVDEYYNNINDTHPPATYSPTVHRSPVAILRKYSYICLDKNPVYCLGLSPGNLPDEQPYEGLYLQIKHKLRNEFKATDYKKLRWDTVNEEGRIHLSNFTNLCLAKKNINLDVTLADCSRPIVSKYNWFVDTIPDSGGLSIIRLNNTDWCLSVRNCYKDINGNCIPDSYTGVALGTIDSPFLDGARVGLNGCYDKLNIPDYKDAQLFRVTLDCNAGCSPDLLNNNICDPACNNDVCLWDHSQCRFTAPPVDGQSRTPKPTPKPSSEPQPTLSPETVKEIGGVGGFFLGLIILILICCLSFCVVFRRRRNRRLNEDEEEEIMVDSNEADPQHLDNKGRENRGKSNTSSNLSSGLSRNRDSVAEEGEFDEIEININGKSRENELNRT